MSELVKSSPRPGARALVGAAAHAQAYASFSASMPTNADLMAENYDAVAFTEQERQAIETIGRPVTVLAVVEDWCPDVVANLPVFARIAEINSKIALNVLLRPSNLKLANAYPGPSGRSHIPTYILLDTQGEELGVLIERPAAITDKIKEYGAAAIAEKAKLFPGVAREDYPADWVRRRTLESHEFRNTFRDLERSEIVNWIVENTRE